MTHLTCLAAGSVSAAVVIMRFDPLEGLAMLLLSSIANAVETRQAVRKVDGSEQESTLLQIAQTEQELGYWEVLA